MEDAHLMTKQTDLVDNLVDMLKVVMKDDKGVTDKDIERIAREFIK